MLTSRCIPNYYVGTELHIVTNKGAEQGLWTKPSGKLQYFSSTRCIDDAPSIGSASKRGALFAGLDLQPCAFSNAAEKAAMAIAPQRSPLFVFLLMFTCVISLSHVLTCE